MSALPRSYRTMEEFEREEIRPSFRIGFSIDDLEESSFEGDLAFGMEKDEFQLDSIESSDDEDEDEDDDDDAIAEVGEE
jgi:hypothetical protein